MGLFDYIHFEAPLPLNKKQSKMFDHILWNKEDFQTKDLENILGNYFVNKNGNLLLEIVKGDYIDKPKPKGHKGFWFPYEFIEKSRTKKKIQHTGAVYFYHIIKDKKGNEWWIEFVSTFLKGKLMEVKLVKIELQTTFEEVKKREDEIKNLFLNDKKKFLTRFRVFMNKITFDTWSQIGRFLFRPFFLKISSFFVNLANLTWRCF